MSLIKTLPASEWVGSRRSCGFWRWGMMPISNLPQTQSPWAPGSKIRSLLIYIRQEGWSQLKLPQLNLGPAISAWTWTLFTAICTKDFLFTSAMERFYLLVILNKKWLQQRGVRLMCPKKQTCSLSSFVSFYYFQNPAFIFLLLTWATGQYWFHSNRIPIWSSLKTQSWLKKKKSD